MARRRSSRDSGIPAAPFKHGQTVKVRLSDGSIKVGTVSFVAWILFPGMHSFEVQADGQTYATHGGGFPHNDRPSIKALTEDMNEEI